MIQRASDTQYYGDGHICSQSGQATNNIIIDNDNTPKGVREKV